MFCIKMKSQLKSLLHEFDSYVDAHIDTALEITAALKSALTSPVTDLIVALIPGNIDDALRNALITALDKTITALNIADACKQYTDVNDKLKCFVTQLQLKDPQLQDAILQKLASLLAGDLDGQRLKQSLYDLYTQAKYSATKAN
jgi:hypothetical protein